MTAESFLAGAAAVAVDPPFGLTMAGYLRTQRTRARAGGLEATAAAFGRDGLRVVLCGVDTLALQAPEVTALRERVAAATGAALDGVVIGASHTHHAPAGDRSLFRTLVGDGETEAANAAYVEQLHDAVVEACVRACEALEPARVRWGAGAAEVGVNRRPPATVVDRSVTALQAVRPDDSAIATVVSHGCHPIALGEGVLAYSPDYAGPLRQTVRDWTGGECVFLQGAAGNVSPLLGGDEEGRAPLRIGRRLALEALHALADAPAWPTRIVPAAMRTATDPRLFLAEPVADDAPVLAAAATEIELPLREPPDAQALAARLAECRARLSAEGEDTRLIAFEVASLERVRVLLEQGAPAVTRQSLSAVRIGDGAIVTGPGEIFAETSLAVKERSPAATTLYAGYANGCLGYLPSAASYAQGGYEVESSHWAYGLPAPPAPEGERILVEASVDLLRGLFAPGDR